MNEHTYVQELRERMEATNEWVRLKLSRSLKRQRRNYDKFVKEETLRLGKKCGFISQQQLEYHRELLIQNGEGHIELSDNYQRASTLSCLNLTAKKK